MAGMRLCTGSISEFGVVVMIVNVRLLLSGGRTPGFVQPGEVDEFPVGAVIPDRLAIVLRPGPFEEPIGWDYAPPFLECLSKAGGRLDRLSASVDVLKCLLAINHPEVHQAPLCREDFAVLEAASYDPMRVGGGDVVAGHVVHEGLDGDAELGSKNSSFTVGQREPATHLRISLAERNGPVSSGCHKGVADASVRRHNLLVWFVVSSASNWRAACTPPRGCLVIPTSTPHGSADWRRCVTAAGRS